MNYKYNYEIKKQKQNPFELWNGGCTGVGQQGEQSVEFGLWILKNIILKFVKCLWIFLSAMCTGTWLDDGLILSMLCNTSCTGPPSYTSCTPGILYPPFYTSCTGIPPPHCNTSCTPGILYPPFNTTFTPGILYPSFNTSYTPGILYPPFSTSYTPGILYPPFYTSCTPVSYTHLTLPTSCCV